MLLALSEKSSFVELIKSYRSTYEIIQFARKIQNHNIDPIERHGDEPRMIQCKDRASELSEINKILEDLKKSTYSSIGVICRTNRQAQELYDDLKQKQEITFLDYRSERFSNGITVTSIQMAKGLEFDSVILPSVNQDIYHSEFDRSLLYIACTRAMHQLTLTSYGVISKLLSDC